jgi:hypothetical protein
MMRALNQRADILHRCLCVEEDPVHECNLESIRHLPSCAGIGSGLASSWEEMRLQNLAVTKRVVPRDPTDLVTLAMQL